MMNRIYIGIGEFAIGTKNDILQTVLGSCVGVVIFDRFNHIGGLAHIYLPNSRYGMKKKYYSNGNALSEAPKYADILIPMMINALIKKGAEKKKFNAYIIGGASIFKFENNPSLNVGKKNLEEARSLLKNQSIDTLEIKVGGTTGRKVLFNCRTGDLDVTEFQTMKQNVSSI